MGSQRYKTSNNWAPPPVLSHGEAMTQLDPIFIGRNLVIFHVKFPGSGTPWKMVILTIVFLYVYQRVSHFQLAIWLVVELPLWKIWVKVSWDDEIPNIWKNKKMFLTTKQLWFQWLEIGSLLVVNWWWLFVDVDGLEVYWVESQANKLKVKQKK